MTPLMSSILLVASLCTPEQRVANATYPSRDVPSMPFVSAYARLSDGNIVSIDDRLPPCDIWWVDCNSELNADQLSALGRLSVPGIRYGGPIDSKLVPQLAGLSLRYLRLDGRRALTKLDVELIAKLKLLQELEIAFEEPVPDRVMEELAAALRTLPDLRRLNIGIPSSQSLSAPAVADLSACKRLESLTVPGAPGFGDDQVRLFKGHQHLRELGLLGCKHLTDEGLRLLGEVPRLEAVDLLATGVVNDGLAHLARWPRLRALRPPSDLTSEDLDHIIACKSIEELWYDPVAVSDGLIRLRGMHSLRTLHMEVPAAVNGGLRDTHFMELLALSQLRTITYSYGRYTLMSGGWDKPDRVDLLHAYISNKSFVSLVKLSNMRSLRLRIEAPSVRNGQPWGITGEVLTQLPMLTRLEELDLYGPELTDEPLAAVAKIQSLKRLRLFSAEKVTIGAVSQLREALPGCYIFQQNKADPVYRNDPNDRLSTFRRVASWPSYWLSTLWREH